MPTAESVAIREEVAIERIRSATVTLKARTGAQFNDVDLSVYMAPMERQAIVLEQIAAILESLVGVLQDPIVLDEPVEEEAENGTTHEGKRRPSPRHKT